MRLGLGHGLGVKAWIGSRKLGSKAVIVRKGELGLGVSRGQEQGAGTDQDGCETGQGRAGLPRLSGSVW